MNDKITAVVKRPFEEPEITHIEPGLKELQRIVGGSITAADIPDMLDVYGYANDEGMLIGLNPNFFRPEYKDAIVGTAVFMGHDNKGNGASLTQEQADRIIKYLNANAIESLGELAFHVFSDFKFYKPKKQPLQME